MERKREGGPVLHQHRGKPSLVSRFRHPDKEWTPKGLKGALGLDIDEDRIKELLENMAKGDLIARGSSDIRFQGLTDGTLNLIFRHRFEEEIESYQPDLKSEFREELEKLERDKRSLKGLVDHLTGKMAEYQLMTEFRSKKRFAPSRYFANVADDAMLNVVDVKLRTKFPRPDGKAMEIDVLADSDCGRVLALEVKKTQTPVGPTAAKDFLEKMMHLPRCIRKSGCSRRFSPREGSRTRRGKRDRHSEPVRSPRRIARPMGDENNCNSLNMKNSWEIY